MRIPVMCISDIIRPEVDPAGNVKFPQAVDDDSQGGVPLNIIPSGGGPDGGVPLHIIPSGGEPDGAVPLHIRPSGGGPEGGVPLNIIPSGGGPKGSVPLNVKPQEALPKASYRSLPDLSVKLEVVSCL